MGLRKKYRNHCTALVTIIGMRSHEKPFNQANGYWLICVRDAHRFDVPAKPTTFEEPEEGLRGTFR